MRKRHVWVEPLFAEAKEWHGLRGLRLRGLQDANIQGLLIAAGQNLKRFLAAIRVGAAPCPVWESPSAAEGAIQDFTRLRLTISSSGKRIDLIGRA